MSATNLTQYCYKPALESSVELQESQDGNRSIVHIFLNPWPKSVILPYKVRFVLYRSLRLARIFFKKISAVFFAVNCTYSKPEDTEIKSAQSRLGAKTSHQDRTP